MKKNKGASWDIYSSNILLISNTIKPRKLILEATGNIKKDASDIQIGHKIGFLQFPDQEKFGALWFKVPFYELIFPIKVFYRNV